MDMRLVRVVMTAELATLPRTLREWLGRDETGTLAEQLIVNRVMDALTKYEEERSA